MIPASQTCPCGNYMHKPRLGSDGVNRCSACHDVRTRTVHATTRLNLRGATA